MPIRHRTTRRQKRSSRKTRKHPTKQRKQGKQRGGGMWQSFCVACGKPLYNIDLGMLISGGELNVDDMTTLPNTKWMGINVGFDRDHNVVVIVGEDDFYGECPVRKARFQSPITNERLAALAEEGIDVTMFGINSEFDADDATKLNGYVMHIDCLSVLAELYDNISFDFVEQLHEQRCGENDYQDQEYDIESAVSENGVAHFESPLKNPENRKAILDSPCAILVEKKAEELARRRRIVNAARAERASAEKELPPGLSNVFKNYLRAPTNVKPTNRIKNSTETAANNENNENNE